MLLRPYAFSFFFRPVDAVSELPESAVGVDKILVEDLVPRDEWAPYLTLLAIEHELFPELVLFKDNDFDFYLAPEREGSAVKVEPNPEVLANVEWAATKRYFELKEIVPFHWYHYGMSGARDGVAVFAVCDTPITAEVRLHMSMRGEFDDPSVELKYRLCTIVSEGRRRGLYYYLPYYFPFHDLICRRVLTALAREAILAEE